MKNLIVLNCIALGWLLQAQMVQAALIIKVAEPKIYGQKTIVKMDLRNTFTNTVESARAVVFLLDDKFMSMVDQEWKSAMRGYSRMIIGIHPDSGERIELGYAEIRVFGERGKIYAAPNMLYHYVTAHHYKPPEEFVQALKQAPCPPDPKYLDRLKALGLPLSLLQFVEWEAEKKLKKRCSEATVGLN